MPDKAYDVTLYGTWHDYPIWWLNFVNSHVMPTQELLKELDKMNAKYIPGPTINGSSIIRFNSIDDYYLFVLKYS